MAKGYVEQQSSSGLNINGIIEQYQVDSGSNPISAGDFVNYINGKVRNNNLNNTITKGNEYVFNTGETMYISSVLLDTNKVLVSYTDVSNSYYGTSIISSIRKNIIGVAKTGGAPNSYIDVIC